MGLIIFIKNAIAGKVKTRLAASIGNEAALVVYQRLMDHTRMAALGSKTKRYLFYDQAVVEQDDWSASDFTKLVQAEGDLGNRMSEAFRTVLQKENKAVIIGSDCPQLTSALIDDALDRLDLADVVIGPTLDGGYYLLGMKTNQAFLFEDMAWSTALVYSETLKRIQAQDLLYSVLPTLSDMDNIADLQKFPEFSPVKL